MTNSGLAAVTKRRQMLIARAAAQRAELAMLAERWREPIAAAEAAFKLGRVVRRHAAIAVLALAIAMRVQRLRVVAWSGWLLTGLELIQAIRKRTKREAAQSPAS